MNSRVLPTLKFAALLAVVLCAGIAALYVADVFSADQAKSYGLKSLALVGVIALAGVVTGLVAGSSSDA